MQDHNLLGGWNNRMQREAAPGFFSTHTPHFRAIMYKKLRILMADDA